MPNSNSIGSPHDKYFRFMMSDSVIARDFFEQYLPSNIKEIINFDKIHPQKDSFVGDNLKERIADMLFLTEFNSKPGYIY